VTDVSDRNDEMKELHEEMRLLKEQLQKMSERLEGATEEPTHQEAPNAEAEPEEAPRDAETQGHGRDEEEEPPAAPRRRYRGYARPMSPDWGDRLGDYIGEFVDDVMDGVASELERSIFTERGDRMERPTVLTDSEVARTAAVMNSMANEHRIRILKELTWGGMYAGDLQERLKEIGPSTLSSHLDTLEGAGLVYQEKRRGRYLITISGRIAINMAAQIAKRARARGPVLTPMQSPNPE